MRILRAELERAFPAVVLGLLRRLGEIAEGEGAPLYLVGGPVRDLLLGRPVLDIDLVVEGDAVRLAPLLARALGGEVRARSQFGTVKVSSPDLTVDLATARSETYPSPGALPVVRPGSLQEDLARRDFTVNALALHLSPGRFGLLVDPFGGEEDLARRVLRVLHPASFTDDPTRILRGLRYEARLGFRLDPETESLARRDVHYLSTISGDRVRHELERTFQEAFPERALERAEEMGALRAVFPPLRWGPGQRGAVERLRRSGEKAEPLLFLALLACSLPLAEGERLVHRLSLPSRWAKVVRDTLALASRLGDLARPGLRPSAVASLVWGYEPEALQAWALSDERAEVREHLTLFLRRLRYLRPALRGEDLLALGVPQGPLVGRLLQELRCARWDGLLVSREQEEAFVRQRLTELVRQGAGPPSTGGQRGNG